MNIQHAREQMIEQQIRAWEVLDARVLSVMSEVPREKFVPEQYQQLAFADTAIPLPQDQAMLTPNLEGRLLQALMVKPGDQALDIGTGSGFSSACLAALGAKVHSIDIHSELTDRAAAIHADLGITGVTLATTDAAELQDSEKYDVIAVSGSVPQYEKRFARALRIGGRLFLTVGTGPAMEALLITRTGADAWVTESLFETFLPPLLNFSQAPEFKF
ncbi:MAG: protein-L-isoaspartate O-methyltransferase [Gammaproteobacteria bacterium]|nr:protein-L-isoaspartate O-methyltransferase [Gammaproteobacteria bacterium]NNF67237.1 protein-L-isoaspartate O-methyltransferase [Gammaproteobacteria bacterium]